MNEREFNNNIKFFINISLQKGKVERRREGARRGERKAGGREQFQVYRSACVIKNSSTFFLSPNALLQIFQQNSI